MKKAKNTTLDERLKIVTDKISPAIAWLTIQKFIIFYCPLDGEHTRNDLKSMVPF
ncbi:hypothetical protein LI145_08940 [Coprococcus comes]|nr:hypothetical protein [Coprococcus comes]MCB6469743.1 hypothetical protein [Coprococcus comes]